MAASGRYRALEQAGLLHPAPEAVVGEPFRSHPEFFASFDKVQVKYEMLRAHVVDGESATAAAELARVLARVVLPGPGGVRALGDGGACWTSGRGGAGR